MDLDDLKVAWANLEQRVSAAELVALNLQHESRMDKARRMLRRLGWGQALHCLFWMWFVAIVAPFWIEYRHVPHFLIAGLVLHAYGVAVICAGVVQLLLIGRTYYTGPVVPFQRRLAELQRFRIVSGLATGLPWWILWAVVAIVGAQKFLHVDLYAQSTMWFWNSVGFGAVGIGVSLLVARRLAKCKLERATQLADEAAHFARD